MRKSYRYSYKALIVYWLCCTATGQAATTINITFSSSVPQITQTEFIANTTGQYLSSLNPNPYFKDTYSLVILGKRQVVTPPVVIPSSPIYTATAFDQCFAYGFSYGMEEERRADLLLLAGLKDDILITNTCGGFAGNINDTPEHAFLSGCSTGYNMATSTVTERDGLDPVVTLHAP